MTRINFHFYKLINPDTMGILLQIAAVKKAGTVEDCEVSSVQDEHAPELVAEGTQS